MKAKLITLITVLITAYTSVAQDTLRNSSVQDTSSIYRILLDDGTTLTGKIVERNAKQIVFADASIGRVVIPVRKVNQISTVKNNAYCFITLQDGKTFYGTIVSQNENELVLNTTSLGEITVPLARIREIKYVEKNQVVNGKYYFPNPHPTRYLFGPSAIPLKKGEGYFQNAYLLVNSVQIGVSDHFSLGGGLLIPFGFFITPKVGYKVGNNAYVGGGILFASSFIQEMNFGIAVGYGVLTLGNNEHNFTAGIGYGSIKQREYSMYSGTSKSYWKNSQRPMITLSAMTRLGKSISLVTENWIYPVKKYTDRSPYYSYSEKPEYTYGYNGILSLGFRLMGEKSSFDIALARPVTGDGDGFAMPYIDYCFKF